MNLSLERRWRSDKATIGSLFIDGVHECYILEDKVREIEGIDVSQWKVQNETAIPSGHFRVVKTFSQRFQRVTLQIINVPGYTGIRIHSGNVAADTDGCLLPGTDRIDAISVVNSKVACDALEAKIMPKLDTEECWITIVNPPGATPEQMSWEG